MFCLRVIMFLHVNEIYFTVEEVDFLGIVVVLQDI